MRVVILGSGTLDPRPGRASAGVAVEVEQRRLVLDLGRGVVQRMVEFGIDPLELDEVCLTHLHPDHCCDLVPLLFALNYAQPPRERVLTLTGPPGTEAFLTHLQNAWRWLSPRYEREVLESEGSSATRGGVRVETIPLEHGSVVNLGYRIESAGKSLAYTGDTGPCPALLSLARGVDILISECSFSDARAQATHMSPTALAEAATAAGCGRLVITHLYPETDPADVERKVRRGFAGEIVLAHDGLELEL